MTKALGGGLVVVMACMLLLGCGSDGGSNVQLQQELEAAQAEAEALKAQAEAEKKLEAAGSCQEGRLRRKPPRRSRRARLPP